MLDGRSMDALQLAMRIRGWTQICALRSIRLAVCCSADPLPDSARLNADVGFALSTSLAARLSKILRNIEIHGYSGAVTSSCPQGAVFLCALLTRGYIEAAIEEYFIIRKDIEQHYHRVTFLNGMATRQRYPVLHEGGRDYGVL